MKEMNQKKVLGVSLAAFAVLMFVVCLIYEITTPSVTFADIWFSYAVAAVLGAIAALMIWV